MPWPHPKIPLQSLPSTTEIWKVLEYKFKAEEEGTKKFIISSYFYIKMFEFILAQGINCKLLKKKIKGREDRCSGDFPSGRNSYEIA